MGNGKITKTFTQNMLLRKILGAEIPEEDPPSAVDPQRQAQVKP